MFSHMFSHMISHMMSRLLTLQFYALFFLLPPASADEVSALNLVIILVDDLGWMDLSCQGSTYYRTPHIDRLAAEGVRFTDAYAACAVCSPTRAAILTGKYPARLMLTDWLPSGRWNPAARLREGRFLRGLPVEEFTLAEALREAGYRTASIGKWHLGSEPFSLPEHHGFDLNIGGNAHGAPGNYFFPYNGNWLIPATGLRVQWNVLPDGREGEYLTDRLTDDAVRFLHDCGEQPFLLYFPHYGVHTPLQAKAEMVAAYQEVPQDQQQGQPVYAAMVQSIDESVGRIMTTLRQLNKHRNTLVIFTSDNGGFARATDNSPLRANKGAYYEGGIRVPLIIRWPGVAQPGLVVHEPVISTDLYPTCLAAAGLPANPNQHEDGVNLQPLLQAGGRIADRALFWHYPHYNSHPSSVPASVIRRGDWKLIESFDPAGVELYNLRGDLSETSNLVAREPARRETLLQELNQWRQAVRAEMMQPNPDYDPTRVSAGQNRQQQPLNSR